MNENISVLSESEFVSIFRIILDIAIISEKANVLTEKVNIDKESFREFETFVQVYVQLLSNGMSNEEYKDIFSIGVASLKHKFVLKLIKGLEQKLIKDFENNTKQSKINKIKQIQHLFKDTQKNEILKYIKYEKITQPLIEDLREQQLESFFN